MAMNVDIFSVTFACAGICGSFGATDGISVRGYGWLSSSASQSCSTIRDIIALADFYPLTSPLRVAHGELHRRN